ncbi:MAG: hypothetical protein GXO59_02685 [Dictyoglomi bacterium]|jgi:sRNA-binding carbon storage regulator CsrA|nr:hypothetical protein [Dictyoglomota bacterium]
MGKVLFWILVIVAVYILFVVLYKLADIFKRKVVYREGWTGTLVDFRYTMEIKKNRSYTQLTEAFAGQKIKAIKENFAKLGIENPEEYVDIRLVTEVEETVEVENEEGEVEYTTQTESYTEHLSKEQIKAIIQAGDVPRVSGTNVYYEIAIPYVEETLEMMFDTPSGKRIAIYRYREDLDSTSFHLPLKDLATKLKKGEKYTKRPEHQYIDGLEVMGASVKYRKA